MMKKLVSIQYTPVIFNIAFLLLRLVFGIAMCVNHGFPKLVGFAEKKEKFVNFLGMGSTTTLVLVIFAEVFCPILIVLGLFTRLSAVPIVFAMGYAFFISHGGDFWGDGEAAALFLTAFGTNLLCGPGRISVDGLIQK